MKLLFIENRYKTYFFEAIAIELLKKGYEIHWIIQNKNFTPKGNFIFHYLPYPKGNEKIDESIQINHIIASDRQLNFFKKKNTHYFYYYYEKIDAIIKDVKPSFVFGESTAFHELLTIESCKKNGVLYLNPSTCRYPVGRFSFYEYDTLQPYFGSNEQLSDTEALQVIDTIVHRKKAPDYMKTLSVSLRTKLKNKTKLIQSYYLGEKYNTPNLLVKIVLEKRKKKNIKSWDKIAHTNVIATQFKVLYPLQMQPEANIDVWGRKYRNQTELIKQLSDSLPQGVVLYVKPNPKSKYELSDELVELIKNTPNITPLHHQTKMDAVLKEIDLVITVTGTIAMECVWSNKPVVTLIKTLNNTNENCIYLDDIQELPELISKVKNNLFPKINDTAKINFVNLLTSTSFKGIISDPFNDVSCIGQDNLALITNAFVKIITENENYISE